MNLEILSKHIEFIAVKEDLQTLVYADAVGFTTQDLAPGFNYSDADPLILDGANVAYPVPEGAVLFMHAWQVPFEDDGTDPTGTGTALSVTRTSNIIVDPVLVAEGGDVDFDYTAVMNGWEIVSPKDGWIVVKMYGLLVDTPDEDYWYDSSTGEVKTSEGVVVAPADLVDVVQTATANMLKTSMLSFNIAEIMSKHTMDKIRGRCKDKDAWRMHIDFLQMGLTAAKIQFDSLGNTWNSAQIIESLEQYIIINGLDELG